MAISDKILEYRQKNKLTQKVENASWFDLTLIEEKEMEKPKKGRNR